MYRKYFQKLLTKVIRKESSKRANLRKFCQRVHEELIWKNLGLKVKGVESGNNAF